jgi:single-stranded DNA-binding protein
VNREVHAPFCERAGLRCPARLTYVEGRLRTREFEAKDKGQKRQRTEIVAARVHFLGAAPTEHADTTEVEAAPILPPEDVPF